MNIRISFNLELLIVFVVLVFISNPVLSQSPNVQKCLGVNDPSKRLDCYDKLFQSAEANNTSNISNKVDKAEKMEEAKNSNDYGLDKPKEQLSITSKIISVKKKIFMYLYMKMNRLVNLYLT